jgi:drug/metabolite transporter (DMT)-like permease
VLAAVELWRGAAAALTPHSLAYFVLGGLCGTVAAGQLAGATLITVGLWLVVRERDGAGAKPDLRGVLLALGGAVGFAWPTWRSCTTSRCSW